MEEGKDLFRQVFSHLKANIWNYVFSSISSAKYPINLTMASEKVIILPIAISEQMSSVSVPENSGQTNWGSWVSKKAYEMQ